MRVVMYAPHYDVLGGGERVFAALVESMSPLGEVTIFVHQLPDAQRAARLGFPSLALTAASPAVVSAATVGADLFVEVVNGFPLRSFALHNLVVIQFPMAELVTDPRWRAVQLDHLEDVSLVAYSKYVAEWIERRWERSAVVIAPPVNIVGRSTGNARRRVIASVGRFFTSEHSKRQDVLIEAFRRLHRLEPSWTLVLAGGAFGAESEAFIATLREQAAGLPIEFLIDATPTELDALFDSATFFWHATGYGRPADAPERAEHFGITTVEAMARGVVPLVYDDGGQSDIVDDDVGVRWMTIDQLVEATSTVIASPDLQATLSERCVERAQRYSAAAFHETTTQLARQLLARSDSAEWLWGRFHRLAGVAARHSAGYDDLVEQVTAAQRQLAHLDSEIVRRDAEIAALRDRISRDPS